MTQEWAAELAFLCQRTCMIHLHTNSSEAWQNTYHASLPLTWRSSLATSDVGDNSMFADFSQRVQGFGNKSTAIVASVDYMQCRGRHPVSSK